MVQLPVRLLAIKWLALRWVTVWAQVNRLGV